MKRILGIGKHISESAWGILIHDADIDGDGKISYEEFKVMMSKLLEVH